MRKIESVAALALAVLMMFSAVCLAEAPESDGATKTAVIDGATYNLLDTMDATYVSCPSGSEIVVPSSVTYSGKTYTVTNIGSNAFKSNKNITSVVLPGTVEGLPTSCFSGSKVFMAFMTPAKTETHMTMMMTQLPASANPE